MRRPILFTVFVALAISCRKTEVQDVAESPTATAFPQETPVDAKEFQRAAGSFFFLLEWISIKTDSGVEGVRPGTPVRLVEDKGETVRVREGTRTFEVPRYQLTDDADLARRAWRQDAESQKALAEMMQSQYEAYRKKTEEDKKWLDEQDRRVEARRKAAADAIARTQNPLDRGPYNQIYSVPYWYPYGYRYPYPIYVNQFGQRYWIDIYGQRHYLP